MIFLTQTHYWTIVTVTIRPLSWKYLTRGMVFCLKLVRRRSMALGLSSGRPCCSALFCSLSFKRWLVQARNTTRSGVQIYQEKEDVSTHRRSQRLFTRYKDFSLTKVWIDWTSEYLKQVRPLNFTGLNQYCEKRSLQPWEITWQLLHWWCSFNKDGMSPKRWYNLLPADRRRVLPPTQIWGKLLFSNSWKQCELVIQI